MDGLWVQGLKNWPKVQMVSFHPGNLNLLVPDGKGQQQMNANFYQMSPATHLCSVNEHGLKFNRCPSHSVTGYNCFNDYVRLIISESMMMIRMH